MTATCITIEGCIGYAQNTKAFYGKVEITAPSGYKHIHTSDAFKQKVEAEAWLEEACAAVADAMKGRAALSGIKHIRTQTTFNTKRKPKYHG